MKDKSVKQKAQTEKIEKKDVKVEKLDQAMLYEKIVKSQKSETAGIDSLKNFCLKNPAIFDEVLQNKIFFIGQNYLPESKDKFSIAHGSDSDVEMQVLSIKEKAKIT